MRISPSIDNDWGIYRAIVANNQDKLKLGRVQIRIPSFHGTNENGIKDSDLPWGTLCMVGASAQSGSFIVPEKNSTVFVVFENGNHSSPVVLGGVFSRGTQSVRYLSQSPNSYNEKGEQVIEDSQYSEGPPNPERMVPAFQHDVMEEAQVDTATKVIYKSPKGAHVLIKDQDGGETLEIKDANGQVLKFISPMDSYKTRDNKHKYNSPASNLIYRARMLLSNGLGHIISFFSDGKNSDLDIMDTINKMGIEIDGTDGRLRILHHKGLKAEVMLEEGRISLKTEKGLISLEGDELILRGSKIRIEGEDVRVNGSSLGLAGSIKIDGPMISNSRISGNITSTAEAAPAPEFGGVTNSIEEWEEEE